MAISQKTEQGLKWFLIGAVIVAACVAVVWFAKKNPATQATAQDLHVDLTNGNDWVLGKTDAPLVVVEYSDFQCPACLAYEPVVKQMRQDLGDQVVLVYRHYPLITLHANAQMAAQAGQAAGLQGKFWEMHDTLFAKQSTWNTLSDPTDQFVQFAGDLGLNTDQFKTDLTSDAVKQGVDADVASGNQLGIQGTPTFFVNGKQIPEVRSTNEFIQFIRDQLTTQ